MDGESGFVTSEELELGHLEWPRVEAENVGVTGEEVLEPAEESRECADEC